MTVSTLVIMAGGTGGHIMPGLAVAQEMKARGWKVLWLGHPERMEGRLVPAHDIALLPLRFAGLRGRGIMPLLKLPFALLSACWQARRALRQARPGVVLGMGGYVAFPGGLVAAARRIPLLVHEQNAVAGTANRWLARLASTVMAGFPGALPGARVVGNPVRRELLELPPAALRYQQRSGPLHLLVVGGSLGALALNTVLPQALARIAAEQRPLVHHQAGEPHLAGLRDAYHAAGVDAQCVSFIEDMAQALAWADVIVCRAGAMTVAEVAAAGVAALFVPFPHAIDDHQTANAQYLVRDHAAWMCAQEVFTPQWLAQWLEERTRDELAQIAARAHDHALPQAVQVIADACEHAAGRLAS